MVDEGNIISSFTSKEDYTKILNFNHLTYFIADAYSFGKTKVKQNTIVFEKNISLQGMMKNLILLGKLLLALWFIAIDVPSVDAESCNPLCEFPHMCQSEIGKCLCAFGWTGPNAFYIEENRVLADYCKQPCHYTPVVKNPACAADSPPATTTTTTTPRITTTTTTATTTTPPTTTTTTTTRSPADILAELCEQIKMAQSLLNQLKGIFPADPATTPDENLLT